MDDFFKHKTTECGLGVHYTLIMWVTRVRLVAYVGCEVAYTMRNGEAPRTQHTGSRWSFTSDFWAKFYAKRPGLPFLR